MKAMLWPVFGMVAVTAAVWVRMYQVRIGEMRERRIHPQSVATSAQAQARLERTQPADNLRNLFELPVLFYAWSALVVASGQGSDALAAAAWVFVVLRALHSFIHVTYNKVMHRFLAYVAGAVWLFVMWVGFAWKIAQS